MNFAFPCQVEFAYMAAIAIFMDVVVRRPHSSPRYFKIPAILTALLLAVLCLAPPNLIQRVQNIEFDLYQRIWPRAYDPAVPVRVIDIDEASLKAYGQWPWSRRVLARLVDRLREARISAIAFDIVFSEPDRLSFDRALADLTENERQSLGAPPKIPQSNDTHFAQTLAQSPCILAQVLAADGEATREVKAGFAFAGDDPAQFTLHFQGSVLPLALLREAATGLGAINMAPDDDTIVRRVPLVFALPGGLVPSLDMEALRVAQQAGSYLIKSSNASGLRAFGAKSGLSSVRVGSVVIATDATGAIRPHFSGAQAARRLSAMRILDDGAPLSEMAGRIALIGTSAAALNDIRATPLSGQVPGIDIHAELLESVLAGDVLVRPDFAPGLEAVLVIALAMGGGLLGRKLSPLAGFGSLVGLIFALISLSIAGYLALHLLIDALLPVASLIMSFVGTSFLVYWHTEQQKRWVSEAFARYVSPEFVKRLAQSPERLQLGGETRDLTILFCDVRGFTTLAQSMNAQDVVHFLNRLHTPLTEIILRSGGTIDKYFGDGLMAFWNAPLDVPDHAQRAVAAARAMIQAARELDQALAAEAHQHGQIHVPLRIGIGINSGQTFVGNMGSDQRFDYSIIGDSVNVAARLEAATKDFSASVLISQDSAMRCPDMGLIGLGAVRLKGRSAETKVYGFADQV